nr:ribonuclease H-like domain-containing protein [Tanacetum cinerariifolium]
MQNFISSSDLLCWNIVLKGNSAKSMTTDKDGNLKIRPPITAEEHQKVQREEKARTILLFALPDEHMGDFYHMIDAGDIGNAIKARFSGNAMSKKMQKSFLKQKFEEFKISKEEGLDKGYDKMQKILSQMNTLKIKPEPEDVNKKFLRGLPPSWSGIALILKTKGGLEYISFDDLYNKLRFLEIDTKGYSSSSSILSNATFGSSKSKCSVVDDVIYSFFANHEIDQQFVYEDLDQMNKEEFKKYDLKHQMAMLSIKVHRFKKKHGRKIKFNGRENARFDKKLVKCFNCEKMGHFSRECQAQGGKNSNNYQKYKEAGKDGTDSKDMVVVDGSIDWDKQTKEGNTKPRSLENFGMLAGIKLESDADSECEVVFADDVIPAAAVFVFASELGIDDSKFSIFHTNSNELEGQPIYNSDTSSTPSTNDFQTCDSSQECSRPIYSDHDSKASISSVSAPASESRDTIVIDCARQEDFPSVCTSNCDFHEQRFAKRNAKEKGILKSRPTGKPVNSNRRPKPVSAGRPNPISAG